MHRVIQEVFFMILGGWVVDRERSEVEETSPKIRGS